MTDSRLRELERRWKESGSTRDEAAFLLERARIGALSRRRLRLAALAGSTAAKAVLGGASSVKVLAGAELLPRLKSWGLRAVVVAAHAAAEHALRVTAWPDQAPPWEALRAAKLWLSCPCSRHAEAAHAASIQAFAAAQRAKEDQSFQAAESARAASHAAEACSDPTLAHARWALNAAGWATDQSATSQAVACAVIRWALSDASPEASAPPRTDQHF